MPQAHLTLLALLLALTACGAAGPPVPPEPKPAPGLTVTGQAQMGVVTP